MACLSTGNGSTCLRKAMLVLGVLGASGYSFGQMGGSGTGGGLSGLGGMGSGPVATPPTNGTGFAFYSASMLAGYSTVPVLGQSALPTETGNALGRWTTGGMASMGYNKIIGERSRLGIVYSPGIVVRPQSLDQSRMSHFLNINLVHGLSPRLSLNFGLVGSYAELNQFAFSPARFSRVSSPGALDDLFNTISNGQFSNSQIAAMLTGAPVLDVPARASIYGNQALTVSTTAQLNYKISQKLTWTLNGGGNRFQSIGIKGESFNQTIAPRTTSYSEGTGLTYAVTPGTSIGGFITHKTVQSSYRDNTFLIGNGVVTQKLGQTAVLSVSGGTGRTLSASALRGVLAVDQATAVNNQRTQYLFNADYMQQTSNTQALTMSYNRTFVDEFGLGSQTMHTVAAGWSYVPQGSTMSGSITGGYRKSDLPLADRDLKAFYVSSTINRKVNNQVGVSFQSYFLRATNRLGLLYNSTEREVNSTGVRLLVTWFPTPLDFPNR